MGYLKEVNIKYDMPTADLAVRRATYAIENGRTLGASAVKLIHGYGSSGKGGKIRLEVRAYLERQKARGKIRDYIPGETLFHLRRGDEAAPSPSATTSAATTTSKVPNNGVTIVVL